MTKLQAEKKNGVYLLSVENEYAGYSVASGQDKIPVESIKVNGNYIGTNESFEMECDDYTINENTFTFWVSEGNNV